MYVRTNFSWLYIWLENVALFPQWQMADLYPVSHSAVCKGQCFRRKRLFAFPAFRCSYRISVFTFDYSAFKPIFILYKLLVSSREKACPQPVIALHYITCRPYNWINVCIDIFIDISGRVLAQGKRYLLYQFYLLCEVDFSKRSYDHRVHSWTEPLRHQYCWL